MLLIKMSLMSFMALGVSALAISSTSLLEAAVVSTTTLPTSGSVVSGSVVSSVSSAVCATCVVEPHTTDVSRPIASGTEYLPDGNITRVDDSVLSSAVCITCVLETPTTDVSLPIASGTEYLPDGNITRIDDGGWATFYDDSYCHAGGGEAVSLTNPGCLTEHGRNSIGFKAGALRFPTALIFSPGNDCNCQYTCLPVEVNTCLSLIGQVDANSFRFIRVGPGGCPDDQCTPT